MTAQVRAVERYGNPRDVAIIVTLLQTGLRVGELVALELDVVELFPRKGAVIVLHGKCGRHHEVPLNAAARRVLDRCLEVRPVSQSKRLFLVQRGDRARSCERVVRAYARLAQRVDVTLQRCGTPSPSECWRPARRTSPASGCWAKPVLRRLRSILNLDGRIGLRRRIREVEIWIEVGL